jgi:hypothetical protein
MAEDPLRHTTRDGLSYNNYDGAGKLTFLIFSSRLTMLGSSHDYDARFSDPRQASVGLPLRQAFRQPQGEPKMHDITEKFKRACDGRITLSFSFKKKSMRSRFPRESAVHMLYQLSNLTFTFGELLLIFLSST